jgi:hypothetical protein
MCRTCERSPDRGSPPSPAGAILAEYTKRYGKINLDRTGIDAVRWVELYEELALRRMRDGPTCPLDLFADEAEQLAVGFVQPEDYADDPEYPDQGHEIVPLETADIKVR